jgi:hypothetical protein
MAPSLSNVGLFSWYIHHNHFRSTGQGEASLTLKTRIIPYLDVYDGRIDPVAALALLKGVPA